MGETYQCRGEQPDDKKTQRATRSELKALLEVQQYCCALSGLPLTPSDAELDHITSLADGGHNGISNLQWLHRDINRMKTTLSQSRFVALCRAVAVANGPDGEEHF